RSSDLLPCSSKSCDLALTAFANGISSSTPLYLSYVSVSLTRKLPKSGSVPQRGWSTSRITCASHAPLEESPPWFSTTTSIPPSSPYSHSRRSPSAASFACASHVPSLAAFTRRIAQPSVFAASTHL